MTVLDPLPRLIERTSSLWKSIMVSMDLKKDTIKGVLNIYKEILIEQDKQQQKVDTRIIMGVLKRILEKENINIDKQIISEFESSVKELKRYYNEYLSKYEKKSN